MKNNGGNIDLKCIVWSMKNGWVWVWWYWRLALRMLLTHLSYITIPLKLLNEESIDVCMSSIIE